MPANLIELPVGSPGPVRLTVTLTAAVPAGALLRLRGGNFGAMMAFNVASASAGGRDVPVVHRRTWDEQMADWMFFVETFSIAVLRPEYPLTAGEELAVELSEPPACQVADLTWDLAAGLVDDVHSRSWQQVSTAAALHFSAGPPTSSRVYVKPNGRMQVQAFDQFGNPARKKDVVHESHELHECGKETKETESPSCNSSNSCNSWTSSLEAPPTPNLEGTPIWFGDIHWHCNFSCDGQRDLAAALASARDELGLDFAGPGDHMLLDGRFLSEHTPEEQAAICERFNQPGRFATVIGAELGTRRGHANFYCADGAAYLAVVERIRKDLPKDFGQWTDRFGFEEFAAICPEGKAVLVPHHPSASSGSVLSADGKQMWGPTAWTVPPQRGLVRLVEIVQGSGCHETEELDEGWDVRMGGVEGSVRVALQRGYRVGFVAGTDNHTGWPSFGGGGKVVGLTGVMADSLDPASLFAALHARRCYATSGARIVAGASCNGHPIGSEFALPARRRPQIEIHILATAPLTHVQVCGPAGVIAELPVQAGCMDFGATWKDERRDRPAGEACYYVRARQEDGHRVWLSPFWIQQ